MSTVQDGPKAVALTIDDGPSPVYTPQILAILHRYGVIASFLMIGLNAAAYPGVAREVAAAGHMIVNHTWHHYNLGSMPAAGVQDEIAQATDAIHAATGERPGMFRAPYGVWAPAVFSYCAQAARPRWPGRSTRATGRVPVSARSSAPSSPIPAPVRSSWSTTAARPVADRRGAEDLAAPAARRGLSVHHPVSQARDPSNTQRDCLEIDRSQHTSRSAVPVVVGPATRDSVPRKAPSPQTPAMRGTPLPRRRRCGPFCPEPGRGVPVRNMPPGAKAIAECRKQCGDSLSSKTSRNGPSAVAPTGPKENPGN